MQVADTREWVQHLTGEECVVQARSALEGRTGPGHAPAHSDRASSHQTTWPAGSWVGYQFQRVLSTATRNSPRPVPAPDQAVSSGGCCSQTRVPHRPHGETAWLRWDSRLLVMAWVPNLPVRLLGP